MRGESELRQLERALRSADAPELIRVHERALFLRAYPDTRRTAQMADALLASIAARVSRLADHTAFEAPEVSGIAGTAFTAVFSYEVALSLAARHRIRIDWEAYDEPQRLGPVLRRIIPSINEDWPVEAHVPFRAWLRASMPSGAGELLWLLERIASLPLDQRGRADLYDSMALPLYWETGSGLRTRTRLRLKRPLFLHDAPLLQRQAVSLMEAFTASRIPLRRLSRSHAVPILELILDTSAMRYRELYGFSHPDTALVRHADLGRGTDIYFFGVPQAWRLPLRVYHAGMFFKNGVPTGYVELLSIFDRAEIGFNLYYTFREGETAWLYARVVALFHQVLGVHTFAIDPYQIGLENEEAIQSGAFWFYRKLGFRPVEPAIARLAQSEERRIAKSPGYRSSPAMLRKLASSAMVFEGPGAIRGMWDGFEARRVGMALAKRKTNPLARFIRAKNGPDETACLKRMREHPRLRDALLRLSKV